MFKLVFCVPVLVSVGSMSDVVKTPMHQELSKKSGVDVTCQLIFRFVSSFLVKIDQKILN